MHVHIYGQIINKDTSRRPTMNTAHLVAALALLSGGARASEDDRSTVVVALRHDPARLAKLAATLDDVADPLSPRYGKWLSSEAVGAFTAAPRAQVAAVERWLEGEAVTCRASGDAFVADTLAFAVIGQVCL